MVEQDKFLTLEQLNAKLKETDIDWVAEENEISKLLPTTKASKLFGLQVGEEERIKSISESLSKEVNLFAAPPSPPIKIDWRNHNGKNWVTPVKNQGSCGSCVSFATCASLESRSKIVENDATLNIDLSEAHLFFCGAGRACNIGWNFDPAMQQCIRTGVGAESNFPYAPVDQNCKNIPSIVKVNNYNRGISEPARQQAISDNGPVIAGMKVFEDFYYYTGGVYQHVTGKLMGLHAVCVVGYDAINRYWIVKNSWGKNWGENGFFRIAFGECGIDSQFPFYDPSVNFIGGNPIS